VGQGEACPTYQRGKSAELRTNVVLGATAGVGLVTAVIGVFFTEWARSTRSTAASTASTAPGPTIAPFVGDRTAGLIGRF
jgi:hypothetical protein